MPGKTRRPSASVAKSLRSASVASRARRGGRSMFPPGPLTEFTRSFALKFFNKPSRLTSLSIRCGNEITFLRNTRSPDLRTVTNSICICSSATKRDSVTVADMKRSRSSSCGKRQQGSMRFCHPRRGTTSVSRASGNSFCSFLSSRLISLKHTRQQPVYSFATRSSSSDSFSGGTSSHVATSTQQGGNVRRALFVFGRPNNSISSSSGGR